jgi:multidrug resistance efflux pump
MQSTSSNTSTQEAEVNENSVIKVLAQLNQLCLAAFKKTKRQELIFQILNDTLQLVPYDRAVLWKMSGRKPSILGASGQSQINKDAGMAEHWQTVIRDLKKPEEIQELSEDSFKKHPALFKEIKRGSLKPQILWLPIHTKNKQTMGLWLERWHQKPWTAGEIDILSFLAQAYGSAWEKFLPKVPIKQVSKKPAFIISALLLMSLFLVEVPLRIVGSCEVVGKDPVVMTAPLDGIIKQVVVKPGQYVQEGDLLFIYDTRLPEQSYKVAQKQVEVTESELHRAMAMTFQDKKQGLSEVAILRETLEKDKLGLQKSEQELLMAKVLSPISGVVLLDSPEKWRGNPVQLGELVLKVSDPSETKISIWIPEDDNIALDSSKQTRIMLNVSPEETFEGKLDYISSYGDVNEKGIPGFKAEANWVKTPENAKMGLKGTAVLYGEDVSMFYWIVRRPWTTVRKFLGF